MKISSVIKILSALAVIFAVNVSSANAASSPAVSAARIFTESERQSAIEYLEKSYPLKKWKTVGFCDENKRPIVLMKVPSFVSWDKNCGLHHFKNGIEFCGLDESTPMLRGSVEFKGHKRNLQIGLEVVAKNTVVTASYDLTAFDSPWKTYGSLKDVKEIKLGERPAFLGVIEDHTGKLPKSIKSQTLIYFATKYAGGMLYFMEKESILQGEIFIWHDEWIFQNIVDGIIKSFEYKVKVD